MKRVDLIEIMGMVTAAWPGVNFGTDMAVAIAAWERLLADLDVAVVVAAIDALATEGREFAPPVGVVRKRAVELGERAAGVGVLDVDEAWAAVMRLVREVGFYDGSPSMLPEPAASVVASLGWDRVCHDENPANLFAQFRDLYRSGVPRAVAEATMPPMARQTLAAIGDLAGRLEGRRRELEP